jgi:predicted 3-demethylubiquinone-9 3-methyltransferase (glyoxalase superfamily)
LVAANSRTYIKMEAEIMQGIVFHLWFDKEAVEAAEWYATLFEDSKITSIETLTDTPSGDTEIVNFQLAGIDFSATSAGPYFKFNPSVSLMVACGDKDEVDRLYNNLSVNGTELMPLGEYPFSKRYAWIQDKYGLSWQIMQVEKIEEHQRIRPALLFAGDACGKAEEAIEYYLSVFKVSNRGFVNYYALGEPADTRAKINYGEMNIQGNQFVLMDHGYGGDFTFNEAFSFMIVCAEQDEIDYFWDKLSFIPAAEQCGWVKDKFGVSWQIVPEILRDILMGGTKEEIKRVTEAFHKMKKIDIKALEKARSGV